MTKSRTPTLVFDVFVPDEALAELVVAEAWELGVEGIEERPDDKRLVLYCAAPQAAALRDGLSAIFGERIRLGDASTVEDVDWSEAWKEGLGPLRVAPRIVVRPSFAPLEEGFASATDLVLTIDPGQAFGTGGHASTTLCLEWIDALIGPGRRFAYGPRVLDVGTGTGILALAALGLGASSAVGHDLDPIAAVEARRAADANGLAAKLRLFTGGIEALAPGRFDLTVANLLKREVLPIAEPVAASIVDEGALVLSGLLAADLDEVVAAFEGFGLSLVETRETLDATGDHWISPLMRPRRPGSSR